MRLRPERWHALRQRCSVACALVVLALTITGCSVSSASSVSRGPSGSTTSPHTTTTASTSTLHVLRTSPFPQNYTPSFERTITDPTQIQALYTALYALPPYPKGTYYCPNDSGLDYQLTFSHGWAPVTLATVRPGGCEAVTLPHGDVRWALGQTHFWATFAETLGLPQSEVAPASTTSGPIAPTPSVGQ